MIRVIEIVSGVWDVVLALMLLCSSYTIHYKEKWDRIISSYLLILLMNVGFQLCDMLAWIFRGNNSTLGYYMVRISNFGFFIGMALLPVGFSLLLKYTIREGNPQAGGIFIKIQTLICLGMIILTVLNCFTGILYKFNENNEYYRAEGNWLIIYYLFCYASIIYIHIFSWTKRKDGNTTVTRMIRITCILVEISSIYQGIFYGISAFNIAVTAGLLLIFLEILRYRSNLLHEEQDRLKENIQQLNQTKQQMLQLQIQPHFMYNTMAAIQAQILEDQERAYESVGTFSSFLRDTINFSKSDQLIPMEEELDFAEKFLELAEMRFGDKLDIEFDIRATDFSVPPFTVQPLIENSLNHGLKAFDHEGCIYIRTYEETKENKKIHILEVEDNGVGMNPSLLQVLQQKSGDHIGMMNVKQRVEMICGGELQVISPVIHNNMEEESSKKDGITRRGTIIRITIPFTGK